MIGILSLRPEDRQRLNAHARERIEEWQSRILRRAPQLGQLTTEQLRAFLNTYLCEDESVEFNKCLDDVRRWLSDCMDTGDRYLPDAYATWVIRPMSLVESLMVEAYQRAKAERREREYDEKWHAAFISIKPPTADAKKYLNDKEYDQFTLVVAKAVDAYLEKGKPYPANLRTPEYLGWLEKIEKRKKEEARRAQASRAAGKYNGRLNQEIKDLASRLDGERIDLAEYLRANIQDRRYTNYSFDYALSEQDKTDLDPTLIKAVTRRLEQLLSSDLRYFVRLPPRCYRLYIPLPIATYRLEEGPCIGVGFEVFAAARSEIWLRPRNKNINGYDFVLPLVEEGNNLIQLDSPKFTAYHHLILTPEELGGYVFWRSIPLILFEGLLSGKARPDGCTISAASDSVTTYRVQGFKKEVDVPDEFAEYLKSIGSIDEMIAVGVMSKKIGSIVKVALGEVEAKHETPPIRGKVMRRDSMKKMAFRLFDQGRRPSDPEVRELGIKPNSAYRYYQQWKKAGNHS